MLNESQLVNEYKDAQNQVLVLLQAEGHDKNTKLEASQESKMQNKK